MAMANVFSPGRESLHLFTVELKVSISVGLSRPRQSSWKGAGWWRVDNNRYI